MDNIILQVEYDCTRTDKYIADNSDISRSFAAKLCEDGKVLVNGKPVAKKQKLVVGDCIEIELPPEQAVEAMPEDIPMHCCITVNFLQ